LIILFKSKPLPFGRLGSVINHHRYDRHRRCFQRFMFSEGLVRSRRYEISACSRKDDHRPRVDGKTSIEFYENLVQYEWNATWSMRAGLPIGCARRTPKRWGRSPKMFTSAHVSRECSSLYVSCARNYIAKKFADWIIQP
jgi:hypothetical protein